MQHDGKQIAVATTTIEHQTLERSPPCPFMQALPPCRVQTIHRCITHATGPPTFTPLRPFVARPAAATCPPLSTPPTPPLAHLVPAATLAPCMQERTSCTKDSLPPRFNLPPTSHTPKAEGDQLAQQQHIVLHIHQAKVEAFKHQEPEALSNLGQPSPQTPFSPTSNARATSS
jgi:hypothetical protein